MRLVSFQIADGPVRLGALHGADDQVADLLAAASALGGRAAPQGLQALSSMHTLMAAGEPGLALAREALAHAVRLGAAQEPPQNASLGAASDPVPAFSFGASHGPLLRRSQVRLLCPLGRPTLIRDFATMETHMRNYLMLRAIERGRGAPDPEAHLEAERRAGKLDLPANWLDVYQHHIGNPLNVIGPEDTLTRPAGVRELDYELELAAVVGRPARDVSEADAEQCIFGYTLMNDFTARDIQRAEGKAAGKSKDFDGSYSLGPCIVTRDAIGDIRALRLRSRLNGEVQAEDTAASMRIGFAQLLSYISRSCTIHPGEVLASGTFARGCGYELGRLLADGDVIELEADGIGVLRNRVLASGGTPAGHQAAALAAH